MASPIQWTWVWVNSGSWWWTGRPGLLQSMGSQRVRQDWATELNWTDAEAKTSIFWSPDVKSWLIGKDPDAGKDWGQEEKGVTEDEMAGWHHWVNGHEFEWTLEDCEGQGSLVCCSPWGLKKSDTTLWLSNNSVSSCGLLILIAMKYFHWISIPQLIYPFTVDGNLDCFQVFG